MIASLRRELQGLGGSKFSRREVLPFGVGAVDAVLASGGLRLDALHEVAGGSSGLGDDAAATLFIAGIAARAWGPVLWVVRRRDLFAPAMTQAGLSPARVIHVEAQDDADVVAIMEEGLRHRSLGAVIGETKRTSLAATRRLQRAAEGGRTIAVLLRRAARTGGDPFKAPSAAVTRWRVSTAATQPLASVSTGQWQVELAEQDDGVAGAWFLQPCDESGRCALPLRRAERRQVTGEAARAA